MAAISARASASSRAVAARSSGAGAEGARVLRPERVLRLGGLLGAGEHLLDVQEGRAERPEMVSLGHRPPSDVEREQGAC